MKRQTTTRGSALHFWFRTGLLACVLFMYPCAARALVADEILVVANSNVPRGGELAKYYMAKRGIPEKNLILLSVTREERCSREEYNKRIVPPIRAFLEDKNRKGPGIRCLLLMHGVPLIVSEPLGDARERTRLSGTLNRLLFQLQQGKNKGEEYQKELKKQIGEIEGKLTVLSNPDQLAAVDSELALVNHSDYPLSGWVPNPLFVGFVAKGQKGMPTTALMVSRLDGPTPEIVRRVIDDSLSAEQKELKGKAYFDARWPAPVNQEVTGYAYYDASIHKAADRVKQSELMPVVLDDKESLFKEGECPDAALYCGWYSLGNYVDAFQWVPGSVGYHIASAECTTLRNPGSNVWCKRMLEKGVAATIGPVAEPYVEGFPVPEVFFSALTKGDLTLAECFAYANPALSWRMVLIGDPLYKPFKKRKAITPAPNA